MINKKQLDSFKKLWGLLCKWQKIKLGQNGNSFCHTDKAMKEESTALEPIYIQANLD